jgi:hypothetical protein
MDAAQPPDVEPLDEDGVLAVTLGLICWTVALVVLAVMGKRGEVLWVCVAAILGGFVALGYVLRRRATYRRSREALG